MNALELQGIQRNIKIQLAADKWEGGNIPLIPRRVGASLPDPRYSEKDHLRIGKIIRRNTFLQSEEGIAFLRELELRKKFEPMFKASLKRAEERVWMPGGPASYPDESLDFIDPGSWPAINNEYRKYVNSLPERAIYKRNVLAQESVRTAPKDLQDAINTPAIDTHDENLFGTIQEEEEEEKQIQKKANKWVGKNPPLAPFKAHELSDSMDSDEILKINKLNNNLRKKAQDKQNKRNYLKSTEGKKFLESLKQNDENSFGKKKNKLIPELKRLQKKAKKMKIRITKTIRGKRVYKTIKELKKKLKLKQ